jgi:predicted metal-dependent hydrolase
VFAQDVQLHHFVAQKSRWILRKITEQREHLATIPLRRYCHGEGLPYLGRTILLAISFGAKAGCELNGQNLYVHLSRRSRLPEAEQVRRLVSYWYQEQALDTLRARTVALSARMGLACTGVTIKATRSKWGHCTSRGAIQYNWQIILAPEAIVDYLVAHEVSHLRHHNHSPEYWQLVASVCPTFRADRAWLKAEGAQLVL